MLCFVYGCYLGLLYLSLFVLVDLAGMVFGLCLLFFGLLDVGGCVCLIVMCLFDLLVGVLVLVVGF